MIRLVAAAILATTTSCFGYIAGITPAPPGSWEMSLKAELMRGLAGPENLPESQQRLKPSVNVYEVSGAYHFGTASIFQDIKLRVSGSYVDSAAESIGGTQFYGRNQSGILGIEAATNFVHEPDRLLGVFVRTQFPIQFDLAKFVNPRLDRIGLGVTTAFRFNDRFSQETLVFFGSGASDGPARHNPSLAVSLLGVYVLKGILSDVSFRFGPFYEGDLAERSDTAYGTVGVRTFRLGFTVTGTVNLTDKLSLEVGYIQKVTGNWFRATVDGFAKLRAVF
jgi:hypothetical protein